MEYVFCGLFILSQAIWRRCFGSDGWNIPILKERGVQHVINVILLGCFLYFVKGITNYYVLSYIVIIVQFIWYSLSFHASMSFGHRGFINDEIEKAYKVYGVGWLTDKIVSPQFKYTYGYDFVWFLIRYTAPLLLLIPVLSDTIVYAGLVTTILYSMCWRISDTSNQKYGGTNWGEYCMGASIGLFLCIC